MAKTKKTSVYFIGAGPGDPELLTLKGKRIIETADVIIYAGSLVNPQIVIERQQRTGDAKLKDAFGGKVPKDRAAILQALREAAGGGRA